MTTAIVGWQTIPGNGAYVAVTSGLTEGGYGPMLVYLECEEPTGAVAPEGVVCFRHHLTHEQLVEAVAARERRGSSRINDLAPHQCVQTWVILPRPIQPPMR